MRKAIAVSATSFDTDTKKNDMRAIVAAFDHYLDEYPVKSARSKHGVMGPVARILDRAKAGGYTEEAIVGDAMRVHEMNPKAHNYLSPVARQHLAEGTNLLLALCRIVPKTSLVKVIDQIDYSLYYARRTKNVAWLEANREAFAEYLRSKYADDATFARAWARTRDAKKLKLSNVPYPSRKGEDYTTRDPQRKQDIDAFWASRDTDADIEDDGEELK